MVSIAFHLFFFKYLILRYLPNGMFTLVLTNSSDLTFFLVDWDTQKLGSKVCWWMNMTTHFSNMKFQHRNGKAN